MKVVFTGTFVHGKRNDIAAAAKASGHQVKSAIAKDVEVLVLGGVGDGEGTSKHKKAQQLGIKIMTEDEWSALASGGAQKDQEEGEEEEEEVQVVENEGKGVTAGTVIVFTGTFVKDKRKAIETAAKANGFKVKPSVTKDVEILVLGGLGDGEGTSKHQKAQQLGIKILSEDDWFKNSKDDRDAAGAAAAPKGSMGMSQAAPLGEPLNKLEDGQETQVASHSSSSTYRLKRTGDMYYCTCPAWRNQSQAVNLRTCKHLKEFLGEAFENARVGGASSVAPVSRKRVGKNSSGSATKKARKGEYEGGVLLANKWDEKKDLTGWHLSEKLDGCRALWTGFDFVSRLGNVFPAPETFKKHMPEGFPLDGELFLGRRLFNDTISIVKGGNVKGWDDIKYHVFDAPHMEELFEERMQVLESKFTDHPVIKLVQHTVVKNNDHVVEELERVIKLDGEGLMVRKPESKYEPTRSSTLLKIKRFYDAECLVTGHEPGKGRNTGVCGALTCQMANGKNFRLGSGLTDKQRANPPKIGAIVTYRFQELTPSGVPRFPTFVCEAIDKDEPSDYIFASSSSDE